eukprot:2120903-Rhodomonas_salina.2
MSGCGSEVQMAHAKVLPLLTPRGTSTSATASPSGTLCTASDAEMNAPSCAPPLPQNDTPIPSPSAKECSVMTAMMSRIFVASSPVMSPSFRSSYPSTQLFVNTTNSIPSTIPTHTRTVCDTSWPISAAPSGSRATPSVTRLTLAESIMPAAIALLTPSQKSLGLLMNSSGNAPSPVLSAANHP